MQVNREQIQGTAACLCSLTPLAAHFWVPLGDSPALPRSQLALRGGFEGAGGDREGCEEINVLLCVNFSQGDGIDGLGKDFVNFFWAVRVRWGGQRAAVGGEGRVKGKENQSGELLVAVPWAGEVWGLWGRQQGWISEVLCPFEGFPGGLLTQGKVDLPSQRSSQCF